MDLVSHLLAYLIGTAIYVAGKTLFYGIVGGSFSAGFKHTVPTAAICFTTLVALHMGLTILQNII